MKIESELSGIFALRSCSSLMSSMWISLFFLAFLISDDACSSFQSFSTTPLYIVEDEEVKRKVVDLIFKGV
jgi:hypothetical protein